MSTIQKSFLTQDAARLVALLSGNVENIRTLSIDEWEDLIHLAANNGVSQMLYTAIKAQLIVPPSVIFESIRSIHLASVVQSTIKFNELKKILIAFENFSITVIPVKGAWLGEAVYGNIALRGMGDVDLWVDRADIEVAKKAMKSLGYLSSSSRKDRPKELQEELIGEIQFFKSGAPMVELHWTIYPGEWLRHASGIVELDIWQRSLPYKSDKVRQLTAEDTIIHIAIHLAVNHQMSMSGLRTLLDLDMVRKKLSVDWACLAGRAKEWHVETAMWLVLRMLELVFGDPEQTLPLNTLQPSALRRSVLERFITPEGICNGLVIRESPIRFLFLFALVDNPFEALWLLWRTLVPDNTWFTLRYGLQNAPKWRVFLQRLWHPLSIAWHKEI